MSECSSLGIRNFDITKVGDIEHEWAIIQLGLDYIGKWLEGCVRKQRKFPAKPHSRHVDLHGLGIYQLLWNFIGRLLSYV